MSTHYLEGSIWRKWDLQVHAPGDHLNDGYKTGDGSDALDEFCHRIEESDVAVLGITDYFSFESVDRFRQRFEELYPNSTKSFFFNLELRINETVNQQNEEVNVHLIFNPTSLDRVPKFLSKLEVVKTGKDQVPITCSDLKSTDDFAAATVTRKTIEKAFEDTFGKKAVRSDHFVVMTAANNDGLRPTRGAKRKEQICDEIDKFSDGFLGGTQNIDYYLGTDRYEDDQTALRKPVVSTSDAHSFDDLANSLGRQRIETIEGRDVVIKDVTWIKADPTFEGLKQILCEPERGERVSIGTLKPDTKEPYMVIRKLRFSDTKDFPEEIVFNENLSSIVGSRSSGKSSLLAYVADAIDPDQVRKITSGPSAGYNWSDIKFQYAVEWASGETSNDIQGRVLFVRQNLLFEQSEEPQAIKERIEPILLKTLPDFAQHYREAVSKIDELNDQVGDGVDEWFDLADEIDSLGKKLRGLGAKTTIGELKIETQNRIDALGGKGKLDEKETAKYQTLRASISELEARAQLINSDLLVLSSNENEYFRAVTVSLRPALSTLPQELFDSVGTMIELHKTEILAQANTQVTTYKAGITSEQREIPSKIDILRKSNKVLLDKYSRHEELETLVKQLDAYTTTLDKIATLEWTGEEKKKQQKAVEAGLVRYINERKAIIDDLPAAIKRETQSALEGIVFDVECQISEDDREHMEVGVNTRDASAFVSNYRLDLVAIRKDPAKFLRAIHSGDQKVIKGNQKADVSTDVLTATETILLSGEMEGDRIGGFLDSTMTPGKRALFALRLILLESDDKWPLLIDQPEDDLDSRSIYDEIVPFLKAKKKERQIIMVSHNANLVIGSDSEQLIITNRNGSDRPNQDGRQFNYLTGSMEYTQVFDEKSKDTLKAQGTCEHACAILDGGRTAFEDRKKKYQIR